MCGICGCFNFNGAPVDEQVLSRMIGAIQHRGPDGEGRYVDREIGLGHRRLSIIDVDGGGQPIGNEDGSIQIVFNGEIYNFIELRKELEAFGHQFKTRSDTEVIVHAYEQWGTACVKRFNGMFGFAIWNSTTRELFIARDHLGIKPLYYVQIGQQILFSSEIKSLLTHPACPRETDLEALAQLFTFRYVPSPKTLFGRIMKLPPGHFLTAGRGGLKIERFWTYVPTIRTKWNEADLVEEYQALLEDAVRIQLRSDVPLGLFLSSGVDSGVLLSIMSKNLPGPVQTFTIGFEGGEKGNEVDDARAMAKMFGADHYFQMLGPDDYMKYYDRYMSDIEEPVGNETAAAFYFVSRLTAQKVKVALSGQGADEPWAGYHRHQGANFSALYSRLPHFLTRGVGAVVGKLPGRMEQLHRAVDSLGEPDMLTRLAKIYSFFSADMKEHLYKGALKSSFDQDHYGTRHALARLQSDVKHLDPLSQILYVDTRANLPDDLLMVGDKTSMANSMEGRVPFLDVRLIEFVESLPPQLKLKGRTGKYLHKKASLKWLPKEIVHRKKKGFANPIADWFRIQMKPFVEECLLSPDSFVARYFNQDYIRQMLIADRQGRAEYRRHIYLLVSLELWHRKFMTK